MESLDVAVLGAGPAGLAAAMRCVDAGLSVAILGPCRTNRPPTSLNSESEPVESLHPGVESVLRTLGCEDALAAASMGRYGGVWTGDRYDALGSDENGRWQGYHISRSQFDQALLRRALQLGSDWRPDARVVGLSSFGDRTLILTAVGEPCMARFVIDASGRQGVAGRRLGLEAIELSEPLIAQTGRLRSPDARPAELQSPSFTPLVSGWLWVAPQEDGQFTYTSVSRPRHRIPTPPHASGPTTPILRPRVANVTWRIFRPVVTDSVLLAGDAAAVLDPAAGQGVLTALWSGAMAGHTAVKALAAPFARTIYLAQYDAVIRERFIRNARRLSEAYHRLGIGLRTN